MSVEVTENQEKDVLVLRVDGRLDAASSPLLERKVNAFVEQGHRKIVMNFESVNYLSSAGMRLLLTVSKKLNSLQGKLVLAAVQEDVMEVIKMAGFDQVLDIRHTEREAVTSF